MKTENFNDLIAFLKGGGRAERKRNRATKREFKKQAIEERDENTSKREARKQGRDNYKRFKNRKSTVDREVDKTKLVSKSPSNNYKFNGALPKVEDNKPITPERRFKNNKSNKTDNSQVQVADTITNPVESIVDQINQNDSILNKIPEVNQPVQTRRFSGLPRNEYSTYEDRPSNQVVTQAQQPKSGYNIVDDFVYSYPRYMAPGIGLLNDAINYASRPKQPKQQVVKQEVIKQEKPKRVTQKPNVRQDTTWYSGASQHLGPGAMVDYPEYTPSETPVVNRRGIPVKPSYISPDLGVGTVVGNAMSNSNTNKATYVSPDLGIGSSIGNLISKLFG